LYVSILDILGQHVQHEVALEALPDFSASRVDWPAAQAPARPPSYEGYRGGWAAYFSKTVVGAEVSAAATRADVSEAAVASEVLQAAAATDFSVAATKALVPIASKTSELTEVSVAKAQNSAAATNWRLTLAAAVARKRRAALAAADVGVHTKHWSRQRAVSYLMEKDCIKSAEEVCYHVTY